MAMFVSSVRDVAQASAAGAWRGVDARDHRHAARARRGGRRPGGRTRAAAPAPKPAPVADTNMSFGLSGVYKTDAESLVSNMKTVTEYARGTPGMADTVTGVRKQMNDFVALYRRNGKVSGSSSFSTLYTSINTLSGHYQSYGNGYPVPEKRRKRLLAQYKEVEKALDKGR
ncbi:Photosystem II lipoprotein Psb27 [Porphyridium purpureum]|uniref:Photosystem II lipoprotein Psb27 n=1 Tax=Porphyridium purpureum TaxID=35688 RepID=A0A5J4YTL4_PORPP|nr:Photosystem II lipoprotein Psb27 [Porphyridium purpureum]|eukprot:POR4156..scf229_5